MRNYLLSLLILTSAASFAQNYCGTDMPAEFDEHLRTMDRSFLNEGSRGGAAIQYVPIQYHILGNDSGGNYYPLNLLMQMHCTLNERYATSNLQFYFFAPPHYINSTYYYNDNTNAIGNQLKNAYNVSNVCNVYITNSAAGNCGYATFPGWGAQGIVLNKSCCGLGSTTLTHEMGHYFSLPHTFNGWEGRAATAAAVARDERVNGSNCATSGDYFCDTPADFISDRWNCPYTGSKTDYNGDLYNTVLDGTLYMSYSNDGCQNKFSPNQRSAMYNSRSTDRPYLSYHTVPSDAPLSSVTNVHPENAATNVAAFSQLRWTQNDSATYYHVLLSTSSTFAFNIIIDKWVTDTFLNLSGLGASNLYYWKVMPMTLASTCNEYSRTFSFRTSALNSTITLTPPTCHGGNDGGIYLVPSGGSLPYSYSWASGETWNPITDLVAGTYTVTVTDLTGKIMIADVVLDEPEPIVVDIVPVGPSAISARATGGTGGYTYSWSDGATSQSNSPNTGMVTVTVTDVLGCTGTKTITYNGIDPQSVDMVSGMDVYPNPSRANTSITLNIAAEGHASAQLQIVTLTGAIVYAKTLDLFKGQNAVNLSDINLSSGIYFARLSGERVNLTEKFSVIR